MPSETHAPLYWLIMIGAFLGAVACLFFGAALILQAFTGHGSAAGNILRIGLAIVSLFAGIFFVTVGTLYRMSFEEDRGNEFR